DVAPFHHALVPTDFSPSATYALDLATGLVVSSGSITLLNAVEFPVPIDLGPELVAQARKALEAECARVRTKATQDVSGQVHEGGAVVQVLAALDADKTIELIVMGSHGRTGIKRAILGSVAERTVRHARCP